MKLRLKDIYPGKDKEDIEFYVLDDYQKQPNNFFIKGEYIDIDAIRSWKQKAFTNMLAIATFRKGIVKKYNDLCAKKYSYSETQYVENFFEIFEIANSFDYSKFNDLDENDLLKKLVLQKFDDKKVKKLKTSINIRPFVWGDDDYDDVDYQNLSLFVLSNEKLDLHKTYSKEEILQLYHNKKILVVDVKSKPTRQDVNTSTFFEEFYNIEGRGYANFPEWYKQPITAQIIRDNPQINKIAQDVIEDFKKENKQLAHLMVKSMYKVFQRQKQYFDEYYQKEKERNERKFIDDMEEAKSNFNFREEKLEEEKQNFEDSKEEMKQVVNEFLEK